MGAEIVIGIALVLFLAALAVGAHIHTALFLVGIVGILLLEGPGTVLGIVGPQPFGRVASYSLTTIPLFVLMAQFVLQAGIVKDVFTLVSRASRGRVEPLSALTVSAGGLLGAVSGSGSATSAALGRVAMPELTRYGMSSPLAGATAAAAGSLAGIIPPSIILIIYGVATETAIGSLFMGAILPGIVVVLVYIVAVAVLFRIDAKRAGEPRSPFVAEPIGVGRTAIALGTGLVIVVVVFGGIYSGVVTPTEAGAVGSFAAFGSALLLKKVNREFLTTALTETVKISSMVLLIIIAAQVFSRFVSLSLIPRRLIDALGPLVERPMILLLVLAAVFFVLFMFLEGAAVILMTVPILLPVIAETDIDLLWFGVFISMLCTVGTISPPVGLSVFAVSGATGVPSGPVFRRTVWIAFVTTAIVAVIMILFPALVTWIPSLSG
ncbi:MAG TPA: TRAP transporter large permease subunit [Brevibacterium sp.]|nr:TRAP transporter large permease subunit [Brevibacterium sp.]